MTNPQDKTFNRLSQIRKNADIFGKCTAISAGVYCPTFGVAISASLIRDAAVIIVGTNECTWYARNSAAFRAEQPAHDRFYCCAMDQHDITFGDSGGLKKAICEAAKDRPYSCIILASTCIPEIIGDDIEAIAAEAETEIGIPVLPVHIAHYDHSCNEFTVAISRTLEALGRLMEPMETKPKTFNLLGRNFHPAARGTLLQTELVRILSTAGCELNLILPNACDCEMLKQAPRAKLNIVTNAAGRDLAAYMQKRFGTPFIPFEPSLNLEYIAQGYRQIMKNMNIPYPQELLKSEKNAQEALKQARSVLTGKRFVNGGRPPDAIAATRFLSKLGMEALLVNAYRLEENSEEDIRAVLQSGADPFVNYVANPQAIEELVVELQPDLVVGHGKPGLP